MLKRQYRSLVGLEITLKSASPGKNGSLFKKLINSDGLAFTWQLENVMKRVTLGEPKNYSALSALNRLTQNPGEITYKDNV